MTDDPNTTYWKAQAEAARKQAAENLRLAAERATEIAELQRRVKELDAELLAERLNGEAIDEHHRRETRLQASLISELRERCQVLEFERNVARNHQDDLQAEVNAVRQAVDQHGGAEAVFAGLPANVRAYLVVLVSRGQPVEVHP